ncbi:sulfotransferase family protein [Saccharothrix australiensis]|uniref:Sulfotransferase family protein n=1 Tax=Saccharothrix australiensis TaxID=2072 RepID=A0A495VXB0_9PSEU|nr:sulfotransferase [Saccharothrix australiensis]RKT53834.1 sulfotransferase family protein [Saccharothrix australiensis]
MTPVRSSSPVFIVGTERSGSNLLRLVLDSHPNIAVPHPPHFMRYLAPLAASYGDLAVAANRRALAEDALLLLRRHIHPWPRPVDADRVVATASPSVFGVVSAIYEQHRISTGKARWGCKSTFMVDHVDDVLREYPDAKFVWLVREPRDVAASAKRSVFGHCDPYLMARLWAAQQRRGLAALRRHGPDVVRLLRYEDLVRRPREEITALCDFLGERADPAMFEHHRSTAARQTAHLSESWRKTAEPISARHVGAYRGNLSRHELLLVDKVTADLKERFGYPVDPDAERTATPLLAVRAARSAVLRCAVEFRSLRKDRNYTRRLARDLTVRRLRLKAGLRRRRPAAGRLAAPTDTARTESP